MKSTRPTPAPLNVPGLLDRLGEAIAVVDGGWRVVLLNDAARQLARELLRHDEPLVGQQIWEAVPKLAGTEVEIAARHALTSGNATTLEVRHGPTGRWLEARIAPTGDGLVVLCRDVTQRKEVEARLRQSETSLAEAQALVHLGNWEWLIEEDEVVWSDELYQIYGIERGAVEMTYHTLLGLIHPDDRAFVDDVIARAFNRPQPFTFDHRITRPDGNIRLVRVHGTVELGDDGRPRRMRGTVQDVTERERAEADARRLAGERAARAAAEETQVRITWVLDSIDELFIATDRDWRISFMNARTRAYLEPLGLVPEDVVGQVIWDALPVLADGPFQAAALEAAASGHEVEVEAFYPPLARWLATRIVPGPEGVVSYSRDVTERRAAEAALSEGVELLRSIIEGTSDSIFVKDLHGRYVMVNTAAAARMGGTPEEIVGRTDDAIYPPEIAARLRSNDRAVLRAESTRTYEEVMPEGGRDRVHLATKGVYRDAEGQVAGVIGISRDITERKRAEQRQQLLADASRVLTSSLDYEITLARVARMALPVFADYCAVDLLQSSGDPQRVEFAHVDPEKERALRPVALRYGPTPSRTGLLPISRALKTGEPVFEPQLDLRPLLGEARTDEHREYFEALAPVSLITVPLTIGGTVLGALTFCLSESGRHYVPDDLALARDLADRAALAVQNARLYRAAQAEIAQRAQAEAALRRWAEIFEHAGWGVLMSDAEMRSILSVNPGFARMHGGAVHDFVGRPLAEVMAPEMAARLPELLRQAQQRGRVVFESMHRDRSGHVFPVLVDVTPVRDDHGRVLYYAANVQDLTERRRAEEQLRQAQKMEAVGRLAGGIAHDFNNMLMIIIGFSDFLVAALDPDDRSHADAVEIRKAAERAAALTRQLLVFGSPQMEAPAVVDLNAVVTEMERMLRPLLGEAIELETVLAESARGVEADRGQMEQVVMNLALNARDAMPEGGRLILEIRDVLLGEGEAYHRVGIDIPAGRYVMLVVQDTGHGMTEAVRARIFEPFFTTKTGSQNTGLGLATVYGIVTQSGGYIWVDSAPGQGTTFRLCFPAAAAQPGREVRPPMPAARGSGETILVVEDEESVRTLAVRALRERGYHVLSAEHGRAALAQLAEGNVDLLVTDVVMPEMGGRELVERARIERPELAVLLISGYTDSDALRRGVAELGLPFLQKPFAPESLARRVRELLDAKTTSRPPA